MNENQEENQRGSRGFGAGLTFLQSFLLSGCVIIFVPMVFIGAVTLIIGWGISSAIHESAKMAEGFSLESLTANEDSPGLKILHEGNEDSGVILLIPLTGEIDGDGSPLSGDGMMYRICQDLRLAAKDEIVKAILLQIDSPGGGLTASDLIYSEVCKAKESGKPILAWAPGLMASGGYYAAMGADRVMASPTATVGSIGVIMQHLEFSQLLQSVGIRADAITTGSRKDIGSPLREMKPEERKYLQDIIDSAYDRFLEIVARGRGMDKDALRPLADGGIFTADDALKHGLIDGIGYAQDAIQELEKLAGEENMTVAVYTRIPTFAEIFKEAGIGLSSGFHSAANSTTTPKTDAVWK